MPVENIDSKIAIAVLQEQVGGLRQQHKAQSDDTKERFDEVDKRFDDAEVKADARFDAVDEKLDALIAVFNKGKGAYAVIIILSGFIGAIVLKCIGLAVNFIGK